MKCLFFCIFFAMIASVAWASIDRGMLDAGRDLMEYRWFQVTLLDAYFGFITFYVWVAYKETSKLSKLAWFILIMTLGNIAMSIYVLKEIWPNPNKSFEEILIGRNGTLANTNQ
ncbi:MAG: DUF1475 family protein [Planctomycetota bacterium]